jgi:hypothetical protein
MNLLGNSGIYHRLTYLKEALINFVRAPVLGRINLHHVHDHCLERVTGDAANFFIAIAEELGSTFMGFSSC